MDRSFEPAPSGQTLGLIGGLGVGATIYYYEELVRAHATRGIVPNLVVSHADLSHVLRLVREGKLDALATYLCAHLERLAGAGAGVAAISAVTPHICAAEVRARSPVPIVDAVEAIGRALGARGLTRVALFGTRFIMESDLFGRLPNVALVRPAGDEIDRIDAAYGRIASTGRATPDDIAVLRQIGRRLCNQDGAQSIVLAGTDLSSVWDNDNADFPVLDATAVHIEAIMDRLAR